MLTWIKRKVSSVSLANCSRICRVGLGVRVKAFFNTANCLALIVVCVRFDLEVVEFKFLSL